MSAPTGPEEFAGRYMTQAVESVVRDRSRDVLGHVGLLDLDGVGETVATSVADSLAGPVAVLRSSKHSHHLWGLALDDVEAWVDRAAAIRVVDDDHVAVNSARGVGVLRVEEKVAVTTGEEVKPAPRLVEVVDDHDHDVGALSEPHARILVEEFGAEIDTGDGREWVGHSTSRRVHLAAIGGRSGGA